MPSFNIFASKIYSISNESLEISNNLIVKDACFTNVEISQNLLLLGDASFTHDVEIIGNLTVSGNIIGGLSNNGVTLTDIQDISFTNVDISQNLLVLGDANFTQNVEISGNLIINDRVLDTIITELSSNLYDLSISLSSAGPSIVTSVTGLINSLSGDINDLNEINRNLFNQSINISGSLTISGDSNELRGPEIFYIDPYPYNDISGKVIIRGDLEVKGVETIIDSQTLEISDNKIVINANASVIETGGIEIKTNNNDNDIKSFIWKNTPAQWSIGNETLELGNMNISGLSFNEYRNTTDQSINLLDQSINTLKSDISINTNDISVNTNDISNNNSKIYILESSYNAILSDLSNTKNRLFTIESFFAGPPTITIDGSTTIILNTDENLNINNYMDVSGRDYFGRIIDISLNNVSLIDPSNNNIDNYTIVSDLSIGNYIIKYTVTDIYGNTTIYNRDVSVIPPPPPVVANEFDFLTATLNSNKTIITFANNTTADVLGTTSEVSISSANGIRTQSNSHISLPAFAVSTDFTIELYVNIESHGGWHGLLGLYDGTGTGGRDNILHIGNFQNNNQFYIISAPGTYNVNTANIQNQGPTYHFGSHYSLPYLVHLVWTNDATGSVFYIDGSASDMFEHNNYAGTTIDYTRSGVAAVNNFIGKSSIGDNGIENTLFMRHYDKKLTASEVAILYANLPIVNETYPLAEDIVYFRQQEERLQSQSAWNEPDNITIDGSNGDVFYVRNSTLYGSGSVLRSLRLVDGTTDSGDFGVGFTNGVYTDGANLTANGVTYNGSWFEIEFPYTIVAKKYRFIRATPNFNAAPRSVRAFGSNDGTNLTLISDLSSIQTSDWQLVGSKLLTFQEDFSFQGLTANDYYYDFDLSNNTTSYKHYYLQCYALLGQESTAIQMQLKEFRIIAVNRINLIPPVPVNYPLTADLSSLRVNLPSSNSVTVNGRTYSFTKSNGFTTSNFTALFDKDHMWSSYFQSMYDYGAGSVHGGETFNDSSGNTVSGLWIGMQLSHRIAVTGVKFYNYTGVVDRAAKNFSLYGSDNGSYWNFIGTTGSLAGQSSYSSVGTSEWVDVFDGNYDGANIYYYDFSLINNTKYFHHRIVITEVMSSTVPFQTNELRFVGTADWVYATTIYWWQGSTPHLSLFWNTSQRNYYTSEAGVWNSFDYYLNVLPSNHMTSTTGTLDIGSQIQYDENIHIKFVAGTVSNIRIRGQISSTAYAFWTGSQWEGQIMANGLDSTGRYNMQNSPLIWTNNDGTYADLNIIPPANATQLGLLNGDGRRYILVELS